MKKLSVLVSIAALLASCSHKHLSSTNDIVEIEELYELMQGSFNSAEQAAQDSSFFNISLHMYPIWEDRGHFLYVEQAVNSMQNKPYRQRIYELERVDGKTFNSHVYKIPNDSLWVGKWKTPKDFDTISKKDLIHLNGCEVVLKYISKNHFSGATGASSCESKLYGASYAHSEVTITPETVKSWDRGFDSEGNQIWGAVKSGYIFNKIN